MLNLFSSEPVLEFSTVWTGLRSDAVLLGEGGQLLQELGEQDDGEHSARGLGGDLGAWGQDAERRQRQGVLHETVGPRRVQDDVPATRLQGL